MNASYIIRPITGWPWPDGRPGPDRFKADYHDTIRMLRREVHQRGADEFIIELDVERTQLRRDGTIKPGSRVKSSRVVVTFEDPEHGWVRYHSDQYDSYKANVRGIALSLEALRACDRHGVATGEQYSGFSVARALPGKVLSSEDAAAFISKHSTWMPATILDNKGSAALALRQAFKQTHPDGGGDENDFLAVKQCRTVLEQHHGGPL